MVLLDQRGRGNEGRGEELGMVVHGEEKSVICTHVRTVLIMRHFKRVVLLVVTELCPERIGDLRGFWCVRAGARQCMKGCVRISSGWYKDVSTD